MEKNFTIVKSSISNTFSAQAQASKPPDATGVKTYASLLHHLHSPNPVPSNPICPTINKDQEIVVHLNNSEQKAILKDVSTDVFLKDLNTCIDKMGGHCALRAIKRLPSGDFAVLTINNKEAEKLRSNTQWAGALGSNERVVTRTCGIMINGVRVADFDIINKDQAIEHIKASNTDIEGLQGMNIKWIGWRNTPKAGQELASLVIKFSTPEHANVALDYNILIDQEVYLTEHANLCNIFDVTATGT